MASHREPVIGRENHEGVIELAAATKFIQQATDVVVQRRNGCVVVMDLIAKDLRSSGPKRRPFVSHEHRTIVKRML